MTDYTPSGYPDPSTRWVSALLDAEFALIAAAINSKQDENMLVIGGTEAQGATVNDYVITVTPAITSYTTSSLFVFKATHTNTGAATLKASALASFALKSVSGAALVAGDIVTDSWYIAAYNGTDARLICITKNYVDQLAFSAALPLPISDGVTRVLNSLNGVASWGASGASGAETRTASATLTSTSQNIQVLNMSAFGQAITLPSATTLTAGMGKFVLNNLLGKYPVGVIDGGGRVLGQVNSGELVELHLADIASASGVWSYTGNLDPHFIDSDIGIDIVSSGTINAVSIDATRFLIYYQKPTTGYPAVRLVTDNGVGATPTVSNELVLKSANTTVDQGNCVLVGSSNRILIRLNDSSVVCVDGSTPATITVGADAALTFTGGTLQKILSIDNQYLTAVVTDSGSTLMRAKCIDCGASGTTVTVGAEANTASYGVAPTYIFSKKIGATVVGVFGRYLSGGTYYAAILHSLTRTSGTTLSWSANAGNPTGYRTDNSTQLQTYFEIDADKLMLPFYRNGELGSYVVVTFAASATPTFGTVQNSNVAAASMTFAVTGSPNGSKFIGYTNGLNSSKNIEIVTVTGAVVTVGASTPITADSTISGTTNTVAAIDNNGRGFVSWRSALWSSSGSDKYRYFTTSGTTPTFSTELGGLTGGGQAGLSGSFVFSDRQASCGSGVFSRYANNGASPYISVNTIFTINSDRTENVLAEFDAPTSSVSPVAVQSGGTGGYHASFTSSSGNYPAWTTLSVFASGGYKRAISRYWNASTSPHNSLNSPNQRSLRLKFLNTDMRPGRTSTVRAYRYAEA